MAVITDVQPSNLRKIRRYMNQYKLTHGTDMPSYMLDSLIRGEIEANIARGQHSRALSLQESQGQQRIDLERERVAMEREQMDVNERLRQEEIENQRISGMTQMALTGVALAPELKSGYEAIKSGLSSGYKAGKEAVRAGYNYITGAGPTTTSAATGALADVGTVSAGTDIASTVLPEFETAVAGTAPSMSMISAEPATGAAIGAAEGGTVAGTAGTATGATTSSVASGIMAGVSDAAFFYGLAKMGGALGREILTDNEGRPIGGSVGEYWYNVAESLDRPLNVERYWLKKNWGIDNDIINTGLDILNPLGYAERVVSDWLGTVICSELHRQGDISERDLRWAGIFRMRYTSDSTYIGYNIWAKPVVNLMRSSRVFNYMFKPFARGIVGYIVSTAKRKPTTAFQKLAYFVAKTVSNISYFVTRRGELKWQILQGR